MKKTVTLVLLCVLLLGSISTASMVVAQDGIESVCLITDVGRINDGTFNQYGYEGMVQAEDEFDLDTTFIETVSQTDYEANINTCLEEGYEALITVGFLIGDATLAAAEENPDVFFIGIDQFVAEGSPENYTGVLFREDQSGFLAGVLAALVAADLDSNIIAGVYGDQIPPVEKFRNGYEQGAKYINPDITTLGVYIDDFYAPDRGVSAAQQFIGEGAVVIFGAGGQTGSGGIQAAAQQGIYVIGVDQDEYYTTFGDGETPGAEYLISSAVKRVDTGVFNMVALLAEGDLEAFPGGDNYILDIAANGIELADKHDSDIDDEIFEAVDEVREMLASGELETGVDPVSGKLLEEEG